MATLHHHRGGVKRGIDYYAPRAGTWNYACGWNGGFILKNGAMEVNNIAEGDSGTFTVVAGDVIKVYGGIGVNASTSYSAPNRLYFSDKFGYTATRYTPFTNYIYSIDGCTVEYREGDPDKVTPDATVVLAAGGSDTITNTATTGDYFFSSPDGEFCLAKHSASGDHILVPPSANKVIMWRNQHGPVWGASPTFTGAYYSESEGEANRYNRTSIADGGGGDADMGIPLHMLTRHYVLYGGVADYFIVAVRGTTVTVEEWTGTAWSVYNTHDLTAARIGNPLAASVGSVAGSGPTLMTGVVRVSGTRPFYIRSNFIGTDDEYSPTGIRIPETVKLGAFG